MAGCPLALVASMRQSPGDPRTWPRRNGTQVLRPANQVRSGGASMVASSSRSRSNAVASAFSNAAMYRSRSARACGPVGWAISSAAGASSLSRARARCSALLTDTVVVPSMTATSVAGNASTSRSTRIARCLGGRYCRLAMRASRSPSRAVTMAAGSADSGVTIASGMGCSPPPGPPAAQAAAGAGTPAWRRPRPPGGCRGTRGPCASRWPTRPARLPTRPASGRPPPPR